MAVREFHYEVEVTRLGGVVVRTTIIAVAASEEEAEAEVRDCLETARGISQWSIPLLGSVVRATPATESGHREQGTFSVFDPEALE